VSRSLPTGLRHFFPLLRKARSHFFDVAISRIPARRRSPSSFFFLSGTGIALIEFFLFLFAAKRSRSYRRGVQRRLSSRFILRLIWSECVPFPLGERHFSFLLFSFLEIGETGQSFPFSSPGRRSAVAGDFRFFCRFLFFFFRACCRFPQLGDSSPRRLTVSFLWVVPVLACRSL